MVCQKENACGTSQFTIYDLQIEEILSNFCTSSSRLMVLPALDTKAVDGTSMGSVLESLVSRLLDSCSLSKLMAIGTVHMRVGGCGWACPG